MASTHKRECLCNWIPVHSCARMYDHWTSVCVCVRVSVPACVCVCACMCVFVGSAALHDSCPRAQVTRCVTNLSVLSTQVLRRHQGGWGGKMKEWHEAGCAALLVTVCRTRNCIVKPRELKLGRSNIVFSHSTYPILVPVSIVVRKCRERNTAFWSTVYRVRGFYRCLEVFI